MPRTQFLHEVIVRLTPSRCERRRRFEFGVESFLQRRAERASKSIVALESVREHAEPCLGLSDRGSEALLLVTLIPADKSSPDFARRVAMWRRGDAEAIANEAHQDFHDFPAMADRLLDQRGCGAGIDRRPATGRRFSG